MKVGKGVISVQGVHRVKDVSQQLIEEGISNLWENTDFVSTLFGSLVGYAIIAADFDGDVVAYNEGAHQMYGYAPEEVIGRQNIEIFFPEDFNASGELQHIIADLIRMERYSYEGEKVRKNGDRFPAQIVFTLTKDKEGRVVGFVEIVEDLTERKRAQEALSQSEANLRNVIDSNADGVIVLDGRATLLFVNPAAQALFKKKAEELVGAMFGFPTAVGETTELDIIRENGETAVAEMRVVETEWEGERAYLATLRDITERKQAEEKLQQAHEGLQQAHEELQESEALLIQSEKMSALGTLAAGVAHELNNPLMGILNFCQYCLRHTSEDDRRHSVLGDIERETRRCIDIVRNLLTFSHMEKENEESYEKASCAAVLDRVLKLLSYRIEREEVLVAPHIAEGTPDIPMVANKMQQVFLNILSNALDALRQSAKKEIHIDVRREGESVQVAIADSGCGILSDKLTKVFDPFFTTKPVGQGTGLGLSTSRALVEAHGGEMTCESEPGGGTTVKVWLPIERRKGNEQSCFGN
jgi:PAS domain S-box-containing protein